MGEDAIFLQDNMNYEIVILEEENIPLASGINSSSNVFSYVGILLIIFMALLAICVYAFHCRVKRRRVLLLSKRYQKEAYTGWNIGNLNKEIMRLELEAVTEEENVSDLLQEHEPI